MPTTRQKEPPLLSDDELLGAITRDLKAVYSDIIRQPLPKELAAVLQRLEMRPAASPTDKRCTA